MHILFVHQNFPGQFLNLVQAIANLGDQVVALQSFDRGRLLNVQHVIFKPQGQSQANAHQRYPLQGQEVAHCGVI
jgi:hypothetical protein